MCPVTPHEVLNFDQKVHMHQYMYAYSPDHHACPTLHIIACKYVTMCACHSHPSSSPTPWSEGYMHQYMHVGMHISPSMSDLPPLYTCHPCVALCTCPSHPSSGPIPWSGLHASVYVCMFTSSLRPALPHPLCILMHKCVYPCVDLCAHPSYP